MLFETKLSSKDSQFINKRARGILVGGQFQVSIFVVPHETSEQILRLRKLNSILASRWRALVGE